MTKKTDTKSIPCLICYSASYSCFRPEEIDRQAPRRRWKGSSLSSARPSGGGGRGRRTATSAWSSPMARHVYRSTRASTLTSRRAAGSPPDVLRPTGSVSRTITTMTGRGRRNSPASCLRRPAGAGCPGPGGSAACACSCVSVARKNEPLLLSVPCSLCKRKILPSGFLQSCI